MKRFLAAAAAASLMLAGCGSNPADRAISGSAIGGATGAVGTALFGGSVLTGAAVGAAAGAITGAATDQSQINFGKPLWRQ